MLYWIIRDVLGIIIFIIAFFLIKKLNFSSPEKAFEYISSWKIQHVVNGSESDLVIASKGTAEDSSPS